MRTGVLVLLALLAIVPAASASVLVNGDFSAGVTGWTQWRAPWGSTENWGVTTSGPTQPEGTLSGGGGQGSFGWYQVVAIPAGTLVSVTADWKGNIGGAGWAEIDLYSDSNAGANWGGRADVGNANDIAFKKDSWGMNPPTTWGWQPAALSPHPSGNGGVVLSAGYVCVAVKLGASGQPLGSLSVDNIVLTPEPASLLLLGIPLVFVRRRHAR
jgi:hypothetical protein